MDIRRLSSADRVTVERGAAVVCLVGGRSEDFPRADFERSLRGLLAHTPAGVPILAAWPAGEPPATLAPAAPQPERELLVYEPGPGQPFAAAVNAAAALAPDADVAFVSAGVRVGPEWLGRLRAAARSDSTVVSASALSHAGALSVIAAPPAITPVGEGDPDRGAEVRWFGLSPTAPELEADAADRAAQAVAARSPRAYPRISVASSQCAYLRRALLDRLGGLDVGLAPDAAVARLSMDALEHGLLHVAADDVYVSATAGAGSRPKTATHPELERATALSAEDRGDEHGVLRRSLACARVALHGLSVTIDGRALTAAVGGTQVYSVELVLALARTGRVRLRVVVPPDIGAEAASALAAVPEVTLISYQQAVAAAELTDIVHRPQQVFTTDDLALLRLLGERLVVGQQDLIAYRNPAYHASLDAWRRFRRVSRIALAAADSSVFFSEHARRDAIVEDLVDPGRAAVAAIGADGLWDPPADPRPPNGVPPDRELLLCLGADYKHKNRAFAIELVHALRRDHGWNGVLVLAGGHTPYGSSAAEERLVLEQDPELAAAVVDVGSVDAGEKAWLYAHARAVLYPSTYEGFGLIPLEAARAGIPCLFAAQASLAELAKDGLAVLVPWDATVSAEAAAPLLVDAAARAEHVGRLRAVAAALRWDAVAEELIGIYERTLQSPHPSGATRAWQELQSVRHADDVQKRADETWRQYQGLRTSVGTPLVEPGGMLSEDEQRGLMRIASRRGLHALLLGPVGLLGRVGRRARSR